MTYRDLTKTLLLLCLAATLGLIFASAIPGAWRAQVQSLTVTHTRAVETP